MQKAVKSTPIKAVYSISGINDTTNFTSLGDAVIIDNRLYISSPGDLAIYVFAPAASAVDRWSQYGSRPQQKM